MSWKGGIWAEIISMLRLWPGARGEESRWLHAPPHPGHGLLDRRLFVVPLALEPASCRAVLLLGRNHQRRGRAGVDRHLSAESRLAVSFQ